MSGLRPLTLKWLTALLLCAQGPRHLVTGAVNNAVTGEPVRRALVQMYGQTQGSVLTGPDGRFRFEDVPEGQVLFTLQKPGFFDSRSVQTSEWVNQSQTSFRIGSGRNDFQLKLYPSARIVGHITDQEGEPLENVTVQVMLEQIIQGRKQWQNRNGSSTDEDGAFRIDELIPGRYIVFSGGHVLPAASWNERSEVSPPMYYPDAVDLASAQAFDLQPGQEFRADFHLPKERAYRVTAQVAGVPANAGIGASLENASGQPAFFDGVHFDQKLGQFIAPAIPSGRWTVILSGGNRQGQLLEARQEITVDHADVSGVQLLLHRDVSIPITVNHPVNQANIPPLATGENLATFPNSNLQAQLIPADSSRPNRYFAMLQGNPPAFAFFNTPPGKYRLNVQGFGNECLESATYGGVDLTRDYLVVSPDASAQPVTINMRSDCPTLQVAVRPGEHPADGAFVLLVPSSSFADPVVQPVSMAPPGTAGSSVGSTQFTLSPGSYQVFAFSRVEGLEYANPEALRAYPSQSVTLEAGQKMDLTVDLTERKEN